MGQNRQGEGWNGKGGETVGWSGSGGDVHWIASLSSLPTPIATGADLSTDPKLLAQVQGPS